MAKRNNYRDRDYSDYDSYDRNGRTIGSRGSRGSSGRSASSRYDDYDDDYRDNRYDDRYDEDYQDSRYNDRYDDYDRDSRYDDRYDDRYQDDRYDDRYDDGYEDSGYPADSYDDYEDDRYDDRYDDYDDDPYEDDRRVRTQRSSRGRQSSGSTRNARAGNRSRSSRGSRKSGMKKSTKIILLVAELAVLAIVVAALYLTKHVTGVGKMDLDDAEIEENMNTNVVEETETGTMKGYRNIALFGVDSRSDNLASGDNRSDTIIIASINQDTGDVKLVSLYRDTYLNTGNDDYTKCNAAYAKGGPEQAIQMINMNMDMNVTDFITVGFSGLTEVVNDVGGVDIDVDDAELPHLNSYQLTMSQELGLPYEEVTSTGMDHLNGLQATAYCRIRYTAGDDFKRTERQREVLMAVLEKAKTLDAASLEQTANDLFDENMIYTSLDLSEILEMLSNIANYNIIGQDGFPQESMRTTGNVQIGGVGQSCVIPRDLASNVVWLHQYLFDDQNYTASGEVQSYSDKIASDTAGIGE